MAASSIAQFTLLAASALVIMSASMLVPDARAIPVRPARGEPATTLVVVQAPANLAPIPNRDLEVILWEIDPRVPGKEVMVEKHLQRAFRHAAGAETNQRITLGAHATAMPDMVYHVTVAVLDPFGKRTHLGEKNGVRGLASVPSEGKPSQITMVIRLAKPHDAVYEIADEIRRGNNVKATKLAEQRAKDFEELYDVMGLYRPRSKRGMGWGMTPGPIPGQDGLESRLRQIERGIPANFLQMQADNEDAAYWIAALAELTASKPFDFGANGQKKKADFLQKAAALRREADRFAQAVHRKDMPTIQALARTINQACMDCHVVYRD